MATIVNRSARDPADLFCLIELLQKLTADPSRDMETRPSPRPDSSSWTRLDAFAPTLHYFAASLLWHLARPPEEDAGHCRVCGVCLLPPLTTHSLLMTRMTRNMSSDLALY